MDPAIEIILRLAFAGLFGVAAAHKLANLAVFRAALAAYRLLPARLVTSGAFALVAAELAAAILCLVGRGRAAGGAAAGLLILYAAAIAINLARGRRDIDCGCHGPSARQPIGAWLVARNFALGVAALALVVPTIPRALTLIDGVTILGAVASLAALYVALDRLSGNLPRVARLRGTS
jgi:hypothetical protein